VFREKAITLVTFFKETNVNKINRNKKNERMYQAILSLKTLEECEMFFDDLCTVTELQAMEQRFHVAECLSKGMIYNDVLTETGASSATISRVNRSLQYGKGGYDVVFPRLNGEEEADK
jgi:TrpR-related protein YerC/YecD